MACRVYRNEKTNEVERVYAPNGQPSKLYLQLFNLTSDKEAALRWWGHAHVVETEKINAQGEPDVDIAFYKNLINMKAPAVSAAKDDNLESAASNLPKELKDIIREGKQWTVSEDEEHYEYGGKKVTRVSANNGPINTLRATPFTMTQEERVRASAQRKWGDRNPETKLDTERGNLNMEEYIEAETDRMKRATIRGTIMHKYLQMFATPSSENVEKLEQDINNSIAEAGLRGGSFKWLLASNNHARIFAKAGLNIYNSKLPSSLKDKIASEVTVVDDKYFNWGGTIDLLIQHANGKLSLRDFKSGWGFNTQATNAMFKYGVQNNITIMQTPRSTAKLQLMLYAMILKMRNPDQTFESLEVTWIPDRFQLGLQDPQKRVEVEDYLGMIKQYLENERSEDLARMREDMGEENFNRVFDPNEYANRYTENLKKELKDKETQAVLNDKLEELKLLTTFNIAGDRRTEELRNKTAALDKRAQVLFKEVMELTNDLGFDPAESVNDIGWVSLWLASNAQQNSPYIQLYDKMLRARKKRAMERVTKYTTRHKVFLDQIQKIYWRVHGKPITENIAVLKGAFSMTNYQKMFEWLYTDEYGKDNQKIGRKLRTTKEEWAQAREQYPQYTEEDFKVFEAYSKFLNDTYSSFFKGKNALANKRATYRMGQDDEGQMVYEAVTNLELHNEYRTKMRDSAPFAYKEGWFPKVPKTLEEFGHIWNAEYRQELWRRHATLFNEDVFEQELNETEVIPMKYLGSDYANSSNNYSINPEIQFDKFIRNSILKEELEEVYAYGKGIQLYLNNDPSKLDEQGKPMMSNTIEYLKTALDFQVRGRKQLKVPGGFIQRNGSIIRTGDGQRVYMIDWAKVLRTLKSAASAPIMWLKPLQGTANGIFTYMYTLKEAIKNDMLRQKNVGNFIGIDGDEVGFGVKDIRDATLMWFRLQKDAMFGNLKNNKMFRLAKHLNYMPDSFSRSSDYSDYVTTRNKIFSQSTMYMFHSIPEEAIALITMTAQLKSMKTSDGKTVWDHYKLVDKVDEVGNEFKDIEWDGFKRGQKIVPGGQLVDHTELDENELRTLYHIYERMHGGYREDERARLEYFLLGEVFMQFKRYLPNIIKQGFGSRTKLYSYGTYKAAPSWREYDHRDPEVRKDLAIAAGREEKAQALEWNARVQEGRFRVLAGLALSWLPIKVQSMDGRPPGVAQKLAEKVGVFHHESYQWKNLSPYQREVVVDFAVTYTMMGLFILGGMLMFGAADDDDNQIRKYYNRIVGNFSQHFNVYETIRDIVSKNAWPAAARQGWGLIESTGEMSFSMALFLGGYEDEALTQRGDLRGWNQFRRHVRFLSSYRDIARFVKGLEEGDADSIFDIRFRK